MNRWLAALAASFICTTVAAGPIQLVKDINATVGIDAAVTTTPRSLGPVALGSGFVLTLCTHEGRVQACNPWFTDGTSAGARTVHRFDAPTSTEVGPYAAIGATGYFLHTTTTALELWSTDGTAAHAQLVTSIVANWTKTVPVTLAAGTSRLYFSTPAGELYTSDGTAQGTHSIATMLSGFVVQGDSAYFAIVDYPSAGAALYRTDGVNAPVFVKYVNPGSGGYATDLTLINGTLLFWSFGDSSATISQVWASDGTNAGTLPIATLPASTTHSNFVVFGAKAYFVTAIGGASPQAALWSTDGTQAGTVQVAAWSGTETPADPVVAGPWLYFIRGNSLWRTDGSTTTQVTTFAAGGLVAVGSDLYFQNIFAPGGGDVWKVAAGASTATQVLGLGRYFTWAALNDKLLLGFGTASTLDSSGTLTPLAVAPGEPTSSSKCDGGTALAGSVVFFVADDGIHGCELWKTDGTSSGTVMVKDIATSQGSGSSIANLAAAGGLAFFTASVDGTTYQVWLSDGTEAGTMQVGALGSFASPPALVPYPAANTVLLAKGGEIWAAGTATVAPYRVVDPSALGGLSNVTAMFPVSNGFFFIANLASDGSTHLVKYNAGAAMVDLGAMNFFAPYEGKTVGDSLAFFRGASYPVGGPWVSDGTVAGTYSLNPQGVPPPLMVVGHTIVLRNPTPGVVISDLDAHTAYLDISVISPQTFDSQGDALWVISRQSLARLRVGEDHFTAIAGPTVPDCTYLPSANCMVTATPFGAVFINNNAATGSELWVASRTGTGAALVEDFEPGPGSTVVETGSLKPVVMANGMLFFAQHASLGTEPYFLPFDSTPDPITIPALTAAPLGGSVISNPITPSGITTPLDVFANNGQVCVSTTSSCSCDVQPFSSAVTLLPGQSLCVRQQASSTPSTTTVTQVNIGGTFYPFTTTTVAPRTLTVALAGAGTGTVTTVPSGIACGTTCSTSFLEGTSARLIATRNPGSVFTGWTGGACSGTGDCVFTVSADATITATFAPAPIARLERDFDGDGRSDLLLHSPGGTGAWLMSGTTITAAAAVTPRAGDVIKLDGDFNGDGRADLLFRGFDGAYRIALMAGLSPTSVVDILPAGTGWEVVAKGDFNGDGKTDLIWKSADGVYGMWLMDGTNVLGAGLFQSPGVGWDVQLIADFDGDGKSDILWRNADGRIQQWAMDGANSTVQATMTSYQNAWMPLFAGDFDGDGKADIVWTHPDGSIAVWLVDGTTVRSATVLLAGNTGWHVKLVADLDGDGKSDIVLQDENRGTVGAWLMNGNTIASAAQLIGPYSGWSVVASGDFNGDGRADLVWRSNIGAYGVWIMDGLTPLSVAQILGGGTGWDVVP